MEEAVKKAEEERKLYPNPVFEEPRFFSCENSESKEDCCIKKDQQAEKQNDILCQSESCVQGHNRRMVKNKESESEIRQENYAATTR